MCVYISEKRQMLVQLKWHCILAGHTHIYMYIYTDMLIHLYVYAYIYIFVCICGKRQICLYMLLKRGKYSYNCIAS